MAGNGIESRDPVASGPAFPQDCGAISRTATQVNNRFRSIDRDSRNQVARRLRPLLLVAEIEFCISSAHLPFICVMGLE